MTNCPNCGAPIANDICAYCGTIFINPKEYEDLKKELQNNIFRASLEAQNMALINSMKGWAGNDFYCMVSCNRNGAYIDRYEFIARND